MRGRGDRTNRWTVVAPSDRQSHGDMWLCECECGARRLLMDHCSRRKIRTLVPVAVDVTSVNLLAFECARRTSGSRPWQSKIGRFSRTFLTYLTKIP